MSACSGSVVYEIDLSGLRSGGAFFAPDGPRSPPKPPSPRTKIDDWPRKRTLPLSSTDSVATTTTAPLPLSYTALIEGVVVTVASIGIGPDVSSIDCSPWSTMAGFTCIAPPRFSMAGKAGITANVGRTFRSRS
jgi:hypothetical protein